MFDLKVRITTQGNWGGGGMSIHPPSWKNRAGEIFGDRFAKKNYGSL